MKRSSNNAKKQVSTMNAIETAYKGYRFRSRLEARWAVFFDAMGIEWVYETEGFQLKAAKDSAKHAAKELDRIMSDCFGHGEPGGLFDDQGGGE